MFCKIGTQMVLQTENINFTYMHFISLGILLMTQISDPTVKNLRFSKTPTIAHILQYFFLKQIIFRQNTDVIPLKTCIP